MRTIKLHLEIEEYEPLNRLAHEMGVRPECILYAGLNRIMKHVGEPEFREWIAEVEDARKCSLPSWADHAREIHAGLVRLPDVPSARRVELMQNLLNNYGKALSSGAIVTVRGGRIRVSMPY